MPALLCGCTRHLTGNPDGAAGFAPSPAQAQPPSPGRPHSRLDGLDTCTLLAPADLDRIGGVDGTARRDELLPQSCAYALAGGAPGDVAAVALYKPLDQARDQAPAGALVHTRGYPTWLVCEVNAGYQSCSAAVSVHADRSLLVLLSRRDVSEQGVRDDLEQLTRIALSRVPTT